MQIWHPAFLCYIDLNVTIEGEEIINSVTVLPKSFLLLQNDQYVESEQLTASSKTYFLLIQGEMYWSVDVYHAPELTYSYVHLLPKTSH